MIIMKHIFSLPKHLFNDQTITITKLCKLLGIKNNRFELQDANYSRDDVASHKQVRWLLLFGKKSKNNSIFILKKDIFQNKYIWDYAVIVDENLTIVDIYQDYTLLDGGIISGLHHYEYNGKQIVDQKLQERIQSRFHLHQNNKERMKVMTPTIGCTRYY